MSAIPPEPLAYVWGGVWAGSADRGSAALDEVLGGVVTVAGGCAATDTEAAGRACAPWPAVADAIARLPATATAFVWLGDATPSPAVLNRMCEQLAGHDAAVAARPVSDAVKRVAGGVVVAGVDRTGLCRPEPPVLIRASAARDKVAPALAAGREIIAALATSGCTVTVVELAHPDVA